MKSYLPEDTLLYDEDYYTIQEMDFRISEIIREKVFLHTKEEIPHSVFIDVADIEDIKKKNYSLSINMDVKHKVQVEQLPDTNVIVSNWIGHKEQLGINLDGFNELLTEVNHE